MARTRKVQAPPGAVVPRWLKVVRENVTEYERMVLQAPRFGTALDVATALVPRLGAEPVEVMVLALLNGSNAVMALHEVARGGLHSVQVRVNEVYRAACAVGAHAVVLAHNHPSGDHLPSREDVLFTASVQRAGYVLDVPLVDHVVIAGTRFTSMYERGLLLSQDRLEAWGRMPLPENHEGRP